MTDNSQISAQTTDVLPCLLLPVADRTLLLPTVSVAEMAPYNLPSRSNLGPGWYLGEVHWRNTLVPLVCYEMINGDEYPGVSPRSRIAVLNTVSDHPELPFIGILTQGIPRLAQVDNNEIKDTPADPSHSYDLMQVTIAAEEATIPDIAAIEQAFIALDLD